MRARTLAAVAILTTVLGGCSLGGASGGGAGLPAAPTGGQAAAAKLGFPALATRNTIRVAGGDAVTDLAGTVTAVFPATSPTTRPDAVVLVDRSDWQGAIAASVMNAAPLDAPILASDGSSLPPASADALARLHPHGSDLARGAQVIRIGAKPPAPGGMKTGKVGGADPYATAAAIDRFFTAVRGRPSPHVIVASGEQAAYAMPAASWAARSGDSVLFTHQNRVPAVTLKAI